MLNGKFGSTNLRFNTILFRACKQEQEEALTDYVIRLRALVVHTDVDYQSHDDEIVHQIAQFSISKEVRDKTMTPNITLNQLLDWNK